MKESIANSYVFMIIMTFIVIIMLVFLSSLAYSKAFKVKNKIVDLIERYDDGYAEENRASLDQQIEEMLKDIGYRVSNNHNCPTRTTNSGNAISAINNQKNYRYCIYEELQGRGAQYYVVVYMYLDIPIIDSKLQIPLTGQTKVFYQTIDNHHKCNTDSDCGNLKCVNNKCL